MNVVFNRAKRKGFEHGRKPCITVLKQVDRGRHQCRLTTVYSSLIGNDGSRPEFFLQCYLPHKCKLGKSDFVCKSKLIGGLNGTQPATFEFIDKSFSQNSQC